MRRRFNGRMPKAVWGLLMSLLFAVALQVTPFPEAYKTPLAYAAWALCGLCLLGWLLTHLLEGRKERHGSLPGFSLHLYIRVNHLAASRRKYLVDFGKENGERLSLYISKDNILTLSFVDKKREPHLIQLPVGRKGFPLGEWLYASCELGVSGQTTEMSLRVNGKQIGALFLQFKTDLGALDFYNGVIGADLTGKSGAAIDLSDVGVNLKTMTKAEMRLFLKHFGGKKNKYLQFNGEQWMRIGSMVEKGNAMQPDPSKAPRFRIVE